MIYLPEDFIINKLTLKDLVIGDYILKYDYNNFKVVKKSLRIFNQLLKICL
jgi:hypothetical protein